MRRKHFVVFLLASLWTRLPGFDCGCVYGGDEVDYLAPYLTIENGELVTRYPAKEHAPGDNPVPSDPDEVAESPRKESLSLLLWCLPAAIAVLAIAADFRRRRHRQSQETDTASQM